MKKSLLFFLLTICSLGLFAQKTLETIVVKTNGNCDKCGNRMIEAVVFEKGVKDCKYDEKTAMLTVVFDNKKITADKIRQAISKVGYNADDVKANAEARAKLPACCQSDNGGCRSAEHSHQHGACCSHSQNNGKACSQQQKSNPSGCSHQCNGEHKCNH